MDQKKIGFFMAACRREQGLTQAQLAEKLGVTDKAVSKWETGRCLPDASLFVPLTSILGTTIDEFLEGQRSQPVAGPEEKVGSISKLQDAGHKVCMVGDGVNDAPALKTASVGVAMGSMGSDIAVEAADIALMSDDISKLPYLKKLSNATVSTIKFSISLSMCINFLAVTLSVLGMLNPTTGALVHNAGSCFVVLIAALLYDRKFD